MTTPISGQVGRKTPDSRSEWAAYAASAWAFLFALPSFYWAAGGIGGLASTVSPELAWLAEERVPWFVAVLWITGALKVLAGLLALALVRGWGRFLPHRMLLTLAWGAGTLLAFHGALFIGAGSLMLGGLTPGPPSSGPWEVVRWYTFVWGPWFVLGGVLFTVAGWSYLRDLPGRRTAWAFGMLGVLGGLGFSVAMLLVGVG